MADAALDRRAGKVRRLGPQAGQGIEEGRLAGIRIPDQGDVVLLGVGDG